jgi:hypothetical protein
LLRSPQAMNFVLGLTTNTSFEFSDKAMLCSKIQHYFVTVFDAETYAMVG